MDPSEDALFRTTPFRVRIHTPAAALTPTSAALLGVALAFAWLCAFYFRRELRAASAHLRALLLRTLRPSPPSPPSLPRPGPPITLIMVVNPRSGNGAGRLLVELVNALPRASCGGAVEVLPLTVDGLAAALKRAAELVAVGGAGSVRLVCAGGDGTVSAVAGVLHARGLSKVPIAVLPLGTGNDMSRSLGRGGDPPPMNAPALAAWLSRVRAAGTTAVDVWSVAFAVHAGGSIRVLREGVETALPEGAVRGTGVLYCSVGIDARLGWEVEIRRSGSRAANKALYALLGAALIGKGAANATGGMLRRVTCCGRGSGCSGGGSGGAAPLSQLLSSLYLDEVASRGGGSAGGAANRDGGALPPLQSLIAISAPSYAGGTDLWPAAWTPTLNSLRRMWGSGGTAAAPSTPHSPRWLLSLRRAGLALQIAAERLFGKQCGRSLSAIAPPALLRPIVACCSSSRSASGEGLLGQLPPTPDASLGWQSPRMADGMMEIIGASGLFAISGAIGLRCGALGGLHRLGQASSIRLEWPPPLQAGIAAPREENFRGGGGLPLRQGQRGAHSRGARPQRPQGGRCSCAFGERRCRG